MINFINKIMLKKRCVFIDEKNTMEVLTTMDKYIPNKRRNKLQINVCGTIFKKAFCLVFYSTNDEWISIEKDLKFNGFEVSLLRYGINSNDYALEKVES